MHRIGVGRSSDLFRRYCTDGQLPSDRCGWSATRQVRYHSRRRRHHHHHHHTCDTLTSPCRPDDAMCGDGARAKTHCNIWRTAAALRAGLITVTIAYALHTGQSSRVKTGRKKTSHVAVLTFSHPNDARVRCHRVKGKVFPYSLPSVGPGADPGVQAVSPQVT